MWTWMQIVDFKSYAVSFDPQVPNNELIKNHVCPIFWRCMIGRLHVIDEKERMQQL